MKIKWLVLTTVTVIILLVSGVFVHEYLEFIDHWTKDAVLFVNYLLSTMLLIMFYAAILSSAGNEK